MKKFFFTTTFIIVGFLFVVGAVDAIGLGDAAKKFDDVAGQKGAGAQIVGTNPEDIIGIGIGAAITLVGMIFLVLMVYAGYLWMTARGEQEQVDKAQKIITTALIGFFIVASAYAITKFVGGKLGGGGGGGSGAVEEVSEEEDGGLAAKGCCVVCSNSGNLSSFGDGATYVLATETGCKNKNSKEDEIYAKWFYVAAAQCSGDFVVSAVKDTCEDACVNFTATGGFCAY